MAANPWDIVVCGKYDDDPEPIYTAVGKALSAWELIEHHLARMFAFFCGAHDPVLLKRAYGSVTSYLGRSDMLESVAEVYFHRRSAHPMKDRFFSVLKEVDNFSPRRNEIAHGVVGIVFFVNRNERPDDLPDTKFAKPLWVLENSKAVWALMPAQYATRKHKLVPLSEVIAEYGVTSHTFPDDHDFQIRRYAYTAEAVLHYHKQFERLRQAFFDLIIDWMDHDPYEAPEPDL